MYKIGRNFLKVFVFFCIYIFDKICIEYDFAKWVINRHMQSYLKNDQVFLIFTAQICINYNIFKEIICFKIVVTIFFFIKSLQNTFPSMCYFFILSFKLLSCVPNAKRYQWEYKWREYKTSSALQVLPFYIKSSYFFYVYRKFTQRLFVHAFINGFRPLNIFFNTLILHAWITCTCRSTKVQNNEYTVMNVISYCS